MHACHVSRVEDFITKYHKLYGGNCLSFSARGFQNGSIVGLQSGNKCVASMNQPLAGSPTIFIFICRETSCSFMVKCCIRRPESVRSEHKIIMSICSYIYIFVYINILDLGVFLLFSCPGQCQVVATTRDSCKMVASHTIYDHKT